MYAVTKRAGMFSARQQAMLLDVLSKHSEAFPRAHVGSRLDAGLQRESGPGARGAADFQAGVKTSSHRPFYRPDRDAVDADQTLGSPSALTKIVFPGGVIICTRCS